MEAGGTDGEGAGGCSSSAEVEDDEDPDEAVGVMTVVVRFSTAARPSRLALFAGGGEAFSWESLLIM